LFQHHHAYETYPKVILVRSLSLFLSLTVHLLWCLIFYCFTPGGGKRVHFPLLYIFFFFALFSNDQSFIAFVCAFCRKLFFIVWISLSLACSMPLLSAYKFFFRFCLHNERGKKKENVFFSSPLSAWISWRVSSYDNNPWFLAFFTAHTSTQESLTSCVIKHQHILLGFVHKKMRWLITLFGECQY
jgi:hypothetical protein